MIESGWMPSNLFNECLCHFQDLHAFEQQQWAHGSSGVLYDWSDCHTGDRTSCYSQELLGNVSCFAFLSLQTHSILCIPRTSTKTSFFQEPIQPISMHWLSDLLILSLHSFPPEVFSSLLETIPLWRSPPWPLNTNPHFLTPATLDRVSCFSNTFYNVKLIICWWCFLLDYSPWFQALPFLLSRAVSTCAHRCLLNVHEWMKVY